MNSKKPKILFVDDEANILKGLRRGLRGHREVWSMEFAHGAMEALKRLEDQEYDIVVSDMRMPGITGGQLLEHVRTNSPKTVRIILSGFSEEESVLKTVGPAHQFLAKPCDFSELEKVLKQILKLREEFNLAQMQALVGSKQNLPTLPECYQDLCAELDKPTSNSSSIAGIVMQDLGLETQILKVCNSAFFGLPQKVPDLATAISLLGVDTIKSMALIQGLFGEFKGNSEFKAMIKKLCDNSHVVGELSGFFAKSAGFTQSEVKLAKSAGLLSHVGTLILATGWPDMFLTACKSAQNSDNVISLYEKELFATDHALLGSYFLGLWGFPIQLCEAVAYHHCPEKAETPIKPILAALHLAQSVAGYENFDPAQMAKKVSQLDTEFLKGNGLPSDLNEAIDLIEMHLEKEAV